MFKDIPKYSFFVDRKNILGRRIFLKLQRMVTYVIYQPNTMSFLHAKSHKFIEELNAV